MESKNNDLQVEEIAAAVKREMAVTDEVYARISRIDASIGEYEQEDQSILEEEKALLFTIANRSESFVDELNKTRNEID